LHADLQKLDGMDLDMYIISKDLPEEQSLLHGDLEKAFGNSLPFVSDPELKLIDGLGMKNEDAAFRGYALLSPEGEVLLKKVNDHWGEELVQTVEDIKKAYEDM
jgi:alkyl hydroperoxide reductase subunit AhpC